jgi:hypothetical protein
VTTPDTLDESDTFPGEAGRAESRCWRGQQGSKVIMVITVVGKVIRRFPSTGAKVIKMLT